MLSKSQFIPLLGFCAEAGRDRPACTVV